MGTKLSRFIMDRNKTVGFLLSLLLASAVSAGTISPNLSLEIPEAGDTDYPAQIENSLTTLDSAVCDKRTGCTVTGDIIISTGTGSFVGDGSFLTGIPAQIEFVAEDLIGIVDGIEDTFNLSTTPLTNSLKLVMDGLIQEAGVDYTLTLAQIVMTTAPAADTASFVAFYSTGASGSGGGGGSGSLNVDPPILGIGSAGDHLRLDTSSVTLQGNTFNSNNQLVRLDGSLRLPAVNGSLLTNVVAVSFSTVTTSAPITGDGSPSTPVAIDSSSATLLGPNPDHDLLSNITASQHHAKTTDASELTSGNLPNARLDSSSVTLQGPEVSSLAAGALDSLTEISDLCGSSEGIARDAGDTAWVCSSMSVHGNGANCSSGNAPLGVDANGAVEGCFDTFTQAEADAKFNLIRKGVSESVINSTTLQNDDELLVALQANSTYTVRLVFISSSTSDLPDIKFAFSTPSGSTTTFTWMASELTGSFVSGFIDDPTAINQVQIKLTAKAFARIDGTIVTAASSGNLQFRWAQNSLDASNTTTVMRGSHLYSHKH